MWLGFGRRMLWSNLGCWKQQRHCRGPSFLFDASVLRGLGRTWHGLCLNNGFGFGGQAHKDSLSEEDVCIEVAGTKHRAGAFAAPQQVLPFCFILHTPRHVHHPVLAPCRRILHKKKRFVIDFTMTFPGWQ